MENARAVIFMADGFEEIELVTIVDILRRADISALTVSIMGKNEVTGSHNIKVLSDEIFEKAEAEIDSAEMLILPGGSEATSRLGSYLPLTEKLKQFNEEKKLLAAVCAAPTILEKHGILQDKVAVCYPSLRSEITSATFGEGSVIVSGNIITSKAAGTTAEFAFKIVEILTNKQTSEKLAAEMLY